MALDGGFCDAKQLADALVAVANSEKVKDLLLVMAELGVGRRDASARLTGMGRKRPPECTRSMA